VEGLIGVILDITDLKNAENKLKMSHEKYLELNREFTRFGSDPNENIKRLTELCGKILNASCSLYNHVSDKCISSVNAWNTPDNFKLEDKPDGHICYDLVRGYTDKVMIVKNLQKSKYAVSDPFVIPFRLETYMGKTVRCNNKNIGSLCAIYTREYNPSEDDQTIMGIIASAIGIEEERKTVIENLKSSEIKYKNLVENLNEGIWYIDKDANTLFVNPNMAQMLGYTVEEMIGRHLFSFMDEKGIENCKNNLQRRVEGITEEHEFEFITKQGRKINALLKTSPVLNDRGEYNGAIAGVTDITYTRIMEKELENYRDHLEKEIYNKTEELSNNIQELKDKNLQLLSLQKKKNQFITNMSHELRTPLNAILGFVDLLKNKFFGEINQKQEQYVQQIEEAGRYQLKLVNDFLELSKIDAGEIKLNTTMESINYHIQSLYEMLDAQFHKKNINVSIDLDNDLGLVNIDYQKFREIMFNLLSNAIKFTDNNGEIIIKSFRQNGDACINITDNGVGIESKDQDKIFTEFYQTLVVQEKALGGTGIGLALTKRLVELHGGRIWFKSEKGKGSSFSFSIPIGKGGGK
jgi:PAS domain S-box-containing protein